MARGPTPDVKITEALDPQARPYDTYVRPAQTEPSPLHGVAKALEGLSSDLDSFVKGREAKTKADEEARGEYDYFKGVAPGEAEGTRQGLIPTFASKSYNDGYQRAKGYATGYPMQGEIFQDYETMDAATKFSMSPEQMDAWVLGKIREKLGDDNATSDAYKRGIIPHFREIHEKVINKWNADRAENTQKNATAAWGSAVTQTIQAAGRDAEGAVTGEMNYDQLATNVQALRDRGYASGQTDEAINKTITDAVVSEATNRNDPRLLTVLDKMQGRGGRLSLEAYPRDQIVAARQAITTRLEQERNRKRVEDERNQKIATNGAMAKVIGGLVKDPKGYTPEESDLKLIDVLHPEFRNTIITVRKNVLEGNVQEDPAIIGRAMRDILGGSDPWGVIKSLGTEIKSAETISKLWNAAKSAEEYNQRGVKILDNEASKRYEQEIIKRLSPVQATGTKGGEYMQNVLTSNEALAALNDYRSTLMAWIASPEGRNATPLQQQQFIDKLGMEVLNGIQSSQVIDTTYNPAYTQPQGVRRLRDAIGGQGATTPAAGPGNASTGSPAAPTGNPNPLIGSDGKVVGSVPKPPPGQSPVVTKFSQFPEGPPKIEQMALPKRYRDEIDAVAKRRNISSQQVVDEMYSLYQKNLKTVTQGAQTQVAPPAKPIEAAPQGTPGTPEAPPAPSAPMGVPQGMDPSFIDGIVKGVGGYLQERLPGLQLRVPPTGPQSQGTPQGELAPVAPPISQSSLEPFPGEQIQPASLTTLAEEATSRGVDLASLPTPAQPTSPFVQLASLGDSPVTTKNYTNHLDLAKSFLGKNERDDTKALVAFFREAQGSSINPATTPWCARFVNSVLEMNGEKGSGRDNARSLLKVGVAVNPEEAKAGDIIVFKRGNSNWQGHVGFIESIDLRAGTVKVLGGNQGGAAQKGGGVTVQTFRLDSKVLGIRRVTKKIVTAAIEGGESDVGFA